VAGDRCPVAARSVGYDERRMSGLVGIVGDFNASNRTHRMTNEALTYLGLRFRWALWHRALRRANV
jgi:hypothetical protein